MSFPYLSSATNSRMSHHPHGERFGRPFPAIPALALLLLLQQPAPLGAAEGELLIEPQGGSLAVGTVISVSFPNAMIPEDQIGTVAEKPPVVFAPENTPFRLKWISQTEAKIVVMGPVRPGSSQRLAAATGATDAAGAVFSPAIPEHSFEVLPFYVTCNGYADTHLSPNPSLWLSFSHAVDVRKAVNGMHLISVEDRRKIPVDVLLSDSMPASEESEDEYGNGDDGDAIADLRAEAAKRLDQFTTPRFSVSPRQPLPADRTWRLVVEGVSDAGVGAKLDYPAVFPVGRTVRPGVQWIGAFNHAGEAPEILVRFTSSMDHETLNASNIRVEPAVADLRVLAVNSREVRLEGTFDTSRRHTVTVSGRVRGSGGFEMENDSRWGATFKSRQSSIIFPESEITQRSALGLNFSFLQSNTGEGQWRLAPIPAEKLPAVRRKLREFTAVATNPATGEMIPTEDGLAFKDKPTEPLVDFFRLKPLAEGPVEASPSNGEVLREVRWKPAAETPLHGAYLFEVLTGEPGASGTGAAPEQERLFGNRSIVWFTEIAAVQKRSETTLTILLSDLANGAPLADAEVVAATSENLPITSARSDRDGIAKFPVDKVFPPKSGADTTDHFIVRQNGKSYWVDASPSQFSSGYISSYNRPPSGLVGFVTADRPIYRPGEEIRIKGIVREFVEGSPRVPQGGTVKITITNSTTDESVTELEAPLTSLGGFDAGWVFPAGASVGSHQLRCSLGGTEIDGRHWFQVEEYRKPLFSVEVTRSEQSAPGTDSVDVSSVYFHGSPNTGATVRWTATFYSGDDWDWSTKYNDIYSENRRALAYSAEASGEGFLGRDGRLRLEVPAPFKDGNRRSRCYVNWSVDVLSPEGQTISAGTSHLRQLVTAAPGIGATEEPGDKSTARVRLVAVDSQDQPVNGLPMQVELYRLESRTAKKELAPGVFSYANSTAHVRVGSQEAKSGSEILMASGKTGEHVVVARLKNDPLAPQVSERLTLTGDAPALFPVENESGLALELEREEVRPGEKAVVKTKGPQGGRAWVTVENREIVESFIVQIEGNAGRIEVPVKASYAPDCTITVHLLSPGGAQGLATERFGYVNLRVDRPDLRLQPQPVFEAGEVEPGAQVKGTVRVTAEDKPVADAEVAVWVVDESILQLGSWTLPNILPTFLPSAPYGVVTFQGLPQMIASVAARSLFQKGFVIGDGAGDEGGNVLLTRENFKPIAFFAGDLRSDAAGNVGFEFAAPDNLTTWRAIAIAHTSANQFGASSATLVVNKKLMIEPALPRFVRAGDKLELRAVLRQRIADVGSFDVRTTVRNGLTLADGGSISIETGRDTPAVLRFPAVVGSGIGTAKIRFEARGLGAQDAVEIELPIVTPAATVREAIAGTIPADKKFKGETAIPEGWKGRNGLFRASISSSEYLPKLEGIPSILEYPHGCMEQITSRLLVYAELVDLINYLPDSAARKEAMLPMFADVFAKYEASMHANGLLPYWPGGQSGQPFVTTNAAWAFFSARDGEIPVPEHMAERFATVVNDIAEGRIESDNETQTLALMVAAMYVDSAEFNKAAADSLYLRRDRFSIEARAFLALALTVLEHNTPAATQLLAEIGGEIPDDGFDPRNFRSLTRTEAIRIMTKATIGGDSWTDKDAVAARKRLAALMDSSATLSTQENLWTLLAFKAILNLKPAAILPGKLFDPTPSLISENKASLGWTGLDIKGLSQISGKPVKQPLTYVFSGEYELPPEDQSRRDKGLRIERIVRNLTDPARTGRPGSPFRIGDEVLITYRLNSDRLQHYVALEDPLPACLETVNPNIASIAAQYSLPAESDPQAWLSHSEMRDQVTRLYFDQLDKGTSVSSVLARVTSAGASVWPSAQVAPMYDARWSGMSAPANVETIAD